MKIFSYPCKIISVRGTNIQKLPNGGDPMKDFEEIYRTYQADVWRFLMCLTGCDKTASEELTQETFYQAFLSLSRFRGDCQLRTWLFRIARNVYGKYVRKASRQSPLDTAAEIRSDDDMSEDYERKEQLLRMREAVALLEEPARSVVEYRLYSELSYAEIARILMIREGSASVIFNRAKAKISRYLKEVYGYEI